VGTRHVVHAVSLIQKHGFAIHVGAPVHLCRVRFEVEPVVLKLVDADAPRSKGDTGSVVKKLARCDVVRGDSRVPIIIEAIVEEQRASAVFVAV
jgi:hypothetical protein